MGGSVVGITVGCSVGGTVGVDELNADTLVGAKVGNAVGDTVGSLQRHLLDRAERMTLAVKSAFIVSLFPHGHMVQPGGNRFVLVSLKFFDKIARAAAARLHSADDVICATHWPDVRSS